MASKVKTISEEKIKPIIEEMGYEVIEIEYAKKNDGMNLTFYIDNDVGINLDDCEKVSKAIDGVLDELNPTDDQPYILNVSSPGIDRPIKSERDFKRNLNKKVSISLFSKIDEKKVFEGILLDYSNDSVKISADEKIIEFEKTKIANIIPVIEL